MVNLVLCGSEKFCFLVVFHVKGVFLLHMVTIFARDSFPATG